MLVEVRRCEKKNNSRLFRRTLPFDTSRAAYLLVLCVFVLSKRPCLSFFLLLILHGEDGPRPAGCLGHERRLLVALLDLLLVF